MKIFPSASESPIDNITPEKIVAHYITTGGDERLVLRDNGLNKYHVSPVQFEGILNRGSCTCSPFTEEGYRKALDIASHLCSTLDYDEVQLRCIRRIKESINYEYQDRFDVFLAPSGSDLFYYPLLFSKLLYADNKPILNLLTCPEELGSGSLLASSGQYYSSMNQFGEHIPKSLPLSLDLNVETKTYPARCAEGNILDPTQRLYEDIWRYRESHTLIGRLVVGSKSGIENDLRIISETSDSVLWVIDLCQFRVSKTFINALIGMNCLVMITGSKFYQAPPFCGALLVPKIVSNCFKKAVASDIEPFAAIFSRYDIPQEFPDIRAELRSLRNHGLFLRWEAALHEIETFKKLDSSAVATAIYAWQQTIVKRLSRGNRFRKMPISIFPHYTIVSFQVQGAGYFLGYDELKKLYTAICQDTHEGFSRYEKVLFGQPVRYGSGAFIRLAIGAENIRRIVASNCDFSDDLRLIQVIDNYVSKLF